MKRDPFPNICRGTEKISAMRRVQNDMCGESMVDWTTVLGSKAHGSFHTVKIILNETQTTFFANESQIRTNSVFFDRALSETSPWIEAQLKPAAFLRAELHQVFGFCTEKTITLYDDVSPRLFRTIIWWAHHGHHISDKALALILGAKLLPWVKLWVLADYLLIPVLQNRITKFLVDKFVASFSAEQQGFKPFRVHRDAINFVYDNTLPSSRLQKLFTQFIAYSIPPKPLWANIRPNKRILGGFPKHIARAVLGTVYQRASSLHHLGIIHDFPRFIDPIGFILSPASDALQNLVQLCAKWYRMFAPFRAPDGADRIDHFNACRNAYSTLSSSPSERYPADFFLWNSWLCILGTRISEIAKDNPRVSRLLWRYVASHGIAVVWVRDISAPPARLPTHDPSGLSLRDEFNHAFGLAFQVPRVGGKAHPPNPFVVGRGWRTDMQSLDQFVDLGAFLVAEKR